MALNNTLTQEQELVQRQQQLLTAQQILQVKLLEMPLTQLEEKVKEELIVNPALEKDMPEDAESDVRTAEGDVNGSTDYGDEAYSGEDNAHEHDADDYDAENERYEKQSEKEDRDQALDDALDSIDSDDRLVTDYRQKTNNAPASSEQEEMVYGDTTSFRDHLMEQVAEEELTETQRTVVEYLIGMLDDDGLLRTDLSIICDNLAIYYYLDVDIHSVEKALQILQSFDPAGVGARSLQECLLLQIDRREDSVMTRYLRKVIKKYGCDVMIVETGYEVDPQNPWKMQQGRGDYASLIRRMKEDTEGRCKGVFYWEPECRPSQYKLGAFDEQGHPTDILRALVGIENGKLNIQNYDRRVVNIKTNLGDIYVELYNETPGHRDNFLRLAKSGALEGTLFHRVIEDFMIQGGDPDSKDAPKTMEENPAPLLGEGNVKTAEGNDTISAEIIYPRFFHKRGVLAAAREGDAENPTKASSSSQFYITWGKYPGKVGKNPFKPLLDYYKEYGNAGTPWLDGGYTVFGEVISGLEVVDKIQKSRTDSNDRPLRDARIEKMEVIY